MASLITVLQELAHAERDFATTWVVAAERSIRGELTPVAKTAINAQRERLWKLQSDTFDAFVPALIRNLPELGQRIPRPERFPELPSVGGSMPFARSGLGNPIVVAGVAIPPAILFATVVIAIIIVVAAAWALVRAVQVGAELVRRAIAMREDTKRDRERVQAAQVRFERCMQTGSFEACNQQNPIPAPVRADSGEPIGGGGLPWWAIGGITIGVVATAGFFLFAYSKGKYGGVDRNSYALPRNVSDALS
jgi:hypothetical protein